ncbi:APC family permease [Pantanalinema rosaneae CENA516]|uniref:APC family permease n=1 Tax=Pantanalinema rosaneae TaxID=1620701 RepID=UPI003D6E7AEF
MSSPPLLKQQLGIPGAVFMGLGSIIGTGVFVSIGIAAGIAGSAVVLAVAIAAIVAICNGLSAAQLAANHPVSGGTYEYGYRYLTPWMGFTAGWLFLLAKTASAATAALGFAGYLLAAIGITSSSWLVAIALLTVLLLTLLALSGLQRSNTVNIVIVSITLLSLGAFILAGLPVLATQGTTHLTPFFPVDRPIAAILHASALMFVAYTGYGRITTMGEEVHHPRRTIPRAIVITLGLTMLLYLAVAIVGVGTVGTGQLSQLTHLAAPLEVAARQFPTPGVAIGVAIGAMTAMLGVLLNLILGLSRVLLAMGRRGDMPETVARLNRARTAPVVAVLVVGGAIALLVCTGNVKTTWSFSAFTVLVYYALTNLAALRLAPAERLYPRWIAWVGFGSCLLLSFWVEPEIWLVGVGLILSGLVWKIAIGRLGRQQKTERQPRERSQ